MLLNNSEMPYMNLDKKNPQANPKKIAACAKKIKLNLPINNTKQQRQGSLS